MTREEQIRQAGIEYTIKNRPMCIGGGVFSKVVDEMNRNHAFEEGAKWSDANPNLYNDEKYHTVKVSCLDELNRKAVLYDTFLEKTHEYLRTHLWQNVDDDNDPIVESVHNITLDDFIKDFKRYLEE